MGILVVVCALAGWLFDVGLWWGPPALLTASALGGVLTGLVSALTARLVGIRLSRLDLGLGRPVAIGRIGATRVVLRRLPVRTAWAGAARTRDKVRLRFWLAHLGGLLAVAALIALAAGLPDGDVRRGLVVGATLVLIVEFLPATDERGVAGSGWQLLTIPFLPNSAVTHWYVTERVAAARLADERGDFEGAEVLLRQALAEDPDQANAWLELSALLFAKGRFLEAVDVTSELLEQPGLSRSARIGRLNNRAWALLVAAEAGTPAEGWQAQTRHALDEAEEIAGPGNPTLMSTRALYEALDGNADRAVSLARGALDESLDDDARVEELLTLAVAVSRVDDEAVVREWLQAAIELNPDHPRIPGVRRLVIGSGLPTGE